MTYRDYRRTYLAGVPADATTMGQLTLTPPSFDSVEDQAAWNASAVAPLVKELKRTLARALPGSQTVIALGSQRRGSPDLHANIFVSDSVTRAELAAALGKAKNVTAEGWRFGRVHEINVVPVTEETLTLSAHYLAKNASQPVRTPDGDPEHYDSLARELYRLGVPTRRVKHLGGSGARMRFPRGKNGWGSKLGDRPAERREYAKRSKSPLVLCMPILNQTNPENRDPEPDSAPEQIVNLCDSNGVNREHREAIYSEG